MPLPKHDFRYSLLVFGLYVIFGSVASGLGQTPDPLAAGARKATLEYRAALEKLAKRCEDENLSEEAETVRKAVPPRSEEKIYIPKLPVEVLKVQLDAEKKLKRAAEQEKAAQSAQSDQSTARNTRREKQFDWKDEFWKLRREYAQSMFVLARNAARQDRGMLAIQMALVAIHADPDHAAVRKLLGFKRYKDEWRTSWEAAKLAKGFVDHPRFGWIPEKYVKRYEGGERFDGKKWISAEKDAKAHEDIVDGWKIESEHYIVLTNHSIEEGVRMSRKLEDLYRAWKLLFYRYTSTDESLAALFDGKTVRSGTPLRHGFYLFRDREDYVRNLSGSEPGIEQTWGMYVADVRRCFTFAVDENATADDREDVERTLIHEATHQLFYESCEGTEAPGLLSNYWILEGIATYMETLDIEGDYYVVGGVRDLRFQAAAYRVQESNFYEPLRKLTSMGTLDFKKYPKLEPLYSQCAGMTHFLMHANNAAYRDTTLAYLSLVYDGRDAPDMLERLTGKTFSELDTQYKEHLAANTHYSIPKPAKKEEIEEEEDEEEPFVEKQRAAREGGTPP